MSKVSRLLLIPLTIISLGLALTVPADAAPTAPTHDINEIRDICRVIDVGLWGPETNIWTLFKSRSLHGYGLHWADCCFQHGSGSGWAHVRYLIGFGDLEFVNDGWCPGFI